MSNLKVVFMPHPPIIIPLIGRGKEVEAQKTIDGMEEMGLLIKDSQPDTIIYITPHGNSFSNGTCILDEPILKGDFSAFGFPEIKFEKAVNQSLSNEIFLKFEERDFVSVLMDKSLGKRYGGDVSLDNGAMVPMYFIDKHYKDYDMVHITPGHTSLEENYLLGQLLREVAKERRESILLVCSGDLSHALKSEGPYDYHPSGPIFDKLIGEAISNKDPLSLLTMEDKFVEEAGQCGLRSFLMGFGFMDGYQYDSKVIGYEGPFGVGYLTGFLREKTLKEGYSLVEDISHMSRAAYTARVKREDDYIKLARKTIEDYVNHGKRLVFKDVEEEFSPEFIGETKGKKAGTFVTIYKNGGLRGCIGTISPNQENVIEEIINNSISASGHDPRFNPVEAKELSDLEISVDILKEAELIRSKDELNVDKYGVIVEKGYKRGLLLPNLDGVNSVDDQVAIAMDKAGITSEKGMKLYRFEVIRHEIQ